MRVLFKILLGILVGIGLVIAALYTWPAEFVHGFFATVSYVCGLSMYPSHSHRYRLGVSIEVDGQVLSNSSVIEVIWKPQCFLPGSGHWWQWAATVQGQAVLLDLGPRGVLLAPLSGAQYRAMRAFSKSLPVASSAGGDDYLFSGPIQRGYAINESVLRRMSSVSGRANLDPHELPQFLWLKNRDDSTSARWIWYIQFQEVIGEGVRLQSAWVEITTDKPIIDLGEKLVWLDALWRKQSSGWGGGTFYAIELLRTHEMGFQQN